MDISCGYYKIMNVKSRKMLYIAGGSTADGADSIQSAGSGAASQQYQFTTVS
ncbi:RICIN domain-containing protein [Cohnella thermotolerans]|uniref:RICIN domain-containing protein n=1 Tax=Cohnella thermotolerans TaxID=329858 RepID=UPI0003F8DDF6|nr:RICIN domain-containing protein [Cohnella thermotolerans]